MAPLIFTRKKQLSKLTSGLLGASGVFLIVLMQLTRVIDEHPDDPRMRWLTALPVVAMLALAGLALLTRNKMDELERKIQLDALAFAFLISLPLFSLYGLLAQTGVVLLPAVSVTSGLVVCWVFGMLLSLARYS